METDTIRVFFYGLFMDESLLASKCIYPTESTIGYVDGFRLHIGKRATLVPADNSRVYGVLMRITPEESAALYAEPGLADYVAEPVVAHLPGNIRVSAACYNLPSVVGTATDPDYAAALFALAARLGLPADYVRHIRRTARAV